METVAVLVRPAGEEDWAAWYAIFTTVAAEGKWIGRELPVDEDQSRRQFGDTFGACDGAAARPAGEEAVALLAEVSGEAVGQLHLHARRGLGELGMAVLPEWRAQGVGTALMAAAVAWARDHRLHKLTLQLWPHNVAAYRLYERFGFVAEGRLVRHYRRKNGELWDAVVMGLVLDTTSSGSSMGL